MSRFLLFVLFLLLAPVAAMAAGEDYTVSGVTVDQPTSNATMARDEALEVALRKAYEELRTRRAAFGEQLPPTASAPLWKMMQDFEVADERISATRYIGTFTIRFRQSVMADAGTAAAAAELAAAGPMNVQNTVFRFAGLNEWQAARTALKNAAGVRNATVTAFRRNEVYVQLSYTGDANAVIAGLNTQGLTVTAIPNDTTWLLGLRR